MKPEFSAPLNRPLSLGKGIAYASPQIAAAFLVTPVATVLPGIYAKHYGMALTTIATIVLLSRLFDALTDPIIGYLSDHYRRGSGTRKPLIMMGGIFFLISSYFLYSPPEQVSAAYLLAWVLVFYLSWTLFEIPHLAWGSELAMGSSEKTKIYSLREIFVRTGGLLFFMMPFLPLFESQEFTPQVLKWSAISMGFLMLILLVFCVSVVPNGRVIEVHRSESIRLTLNSVRGNKPLLIFIAAFFLTGTGLGMWVGLIYIYMDSYLGMTDKIATIFSLAIGSQIIATGFWYKLSNLCGKKTAWGIGMTLVSVITACTGLLQPGPNVFVQLTLLMIAVFFCYSSLNVIAPSILSDIVDYGTWKFGSDRAGTYFSVYLLVIKANIGIGGALGLGIAGWYGFDPSALEHSEHSLFGLRAAIAYIPAGVLLLAVFIIVKIPINARRHKIIMCSLEKRALKA